MLTTRALRQVALAGNPNTGKTSLFNRLTGLHQKVGNYPGITVERASGTLALAPGLSVELVDVPGTYSLSARSEEERLAIQAIAGLGPHERPALVLVVVDATQLARNLYLALQVLELELPTVIALNMTDALARRGQSVDAAALARALGVPVVSVSAKTGAGLAELRAALAGELQAAERSPAAPRWLASDAPLAADVEAVCEHLPPTWNPHGVARARALALWALLSLDEDDELVHVPEDLRAAVLERRRRAAAAGRSIEDEIIRGRYAWIDSILPGVVHSEPARRASTTDRFDRVLLHPLVGFALFLLLMGVVFQALFSWSEPAIGAIESAVGWLKEAVERALPAGVVRDLFANGVIEGVGAVLVFLPQILLLFFFIGLMEDSGYMARVAFLMDRIMKTIGLHGRAFVPMLSGFACAVPAILATRTMERRRDRLLTMLVVPLMTCSARLPVYTLLIAALFQPGDRALGFLPVQGTLMVAMYVFSTLVALAAAWVLGRTLLRGARVPLILEMPPYRMPQVRSVARMMWTRTRLFVSEAGTIILLCTVAMWGLLSFPREAAGPAGSAVAPAIEESYGGRLGRAIEPAIAPLGFDWKMGIGLIGAFAAREVFVSTMGVVYGISDEADEATPGLRAQLRAERYADGGPVYTPLVALSLMVFFALACQCMSTLAVVKRETAGWGWPSFLFVYMTALAWLASFAVYQGGRALGF